MRIVKENNIVTITYTGKLENGEVFANITEKEPFIFALGQSLAPPTLEAALIGMGIGDSKTIRLDPDEGYGPRRKELLQTLNRESFNRKIDPKPGMVLSMTIDKDGKEHNVPATIVEVNDETLIVDYNHPLAGHHLIYHVTIIAIEDTPE